MANQKFEDFTAGGECRFGDMVVGLRSSDLAHNYKFDFPGLGIKDVNGNYMLQYATAGMSAVNSPKVINSIAGTPVIYTVQGSDANIDLSVQPKNNGALILDELKWPTSDGAAGTFIFTDGVGNLGFTATPVVTDITGTANQVLVNGTTGIPQGGSVTLTTPQDIASTSSPTFLSLTLTTPLSLASGGSNKSLTASAGGIVWTDANSMEVLSGTSTALQMLQSGNATTPTWSTATWPASTTINQILYSSASDTVAGLATANSSVLTTNSSGVPVFSTAMTNGQVIIGSTGATPTAATLTAGGGISISNAAGSITITSSGGGSSWTEVTGTSQAMVVDNGYIANNAGLVTLTIPATAAIGQQFEINGKGAGGWLVQANIGQTIYFSGATSSVAGSIASTHRRDCVGIRCITANTEFEVYSSVGSLTVA